MKRLKSVFVSLALLLFVLVALPVQGEAAEVVAQWYDSWVLTDDGVLTIKKDGGLLGIRDYASQVIHIVVEDGCTKCPLIDEDEFTALKTVTLADSVTSISSFADCVTLESITLSNNITQLPKYVFKGCTSLKSITLPAKLTDIPYHAFYECTALESIVIPESVQTIVFDETSKKSEAFYGCTSLKSVEFLGPVVEIPNGVFYKCSSLETVILPDTVTTIGPYAFYQCAALKNMDWPSNLTTLGEASFSGCTSLKTLEIGQVAEIPQYAFSGCTSLESLVIPAGTVVGASAFNGCTNLKNLTLGEHVQTGWNAFSNCSGLENIVFGKGIHVGRYAFENCTSLVSLELAQDMTIDDHTFQKCSSLREVTIGKGTVLASEGAQFSQCYALETIRLPEGLGEIPYAFVTDAPSLETLVIPEGVTRIGRLAFQFCDNLTTLVLPASLKIVEEGAFTIGGSYDLERHAFYHGPKDQWRAWEDHEESGGGHHVIWKSHPVFMAEGFETYCTQQCVKCSLCDKYFNAEYQEVAHQFVDGKCTACGASNEAVPPTEPTEPTPPPSCPHTNVQYKQVDNSLHECQCLDCGMFLGTSPHYYVDHKCPCGASDEAVPPTEPCIHTNLQYSDLGNGTHEVRCKDCGMLLGPSPHVYTDQKCLCGAVQGCPHNSVSYQMISGEHHHVICADCSAVVRYYELHNLSNGICVCGAKPPCNHTDFQYSDLGNGTHEVRCKDCGDVFKVEPHILHYGVCPCGFQERLDNPFVDVEEKAYYYAPVLWAVKQNITTGVDSTHFNPKDPCTRGQIVTFLWRAKGSPEPTSTNNPFVDVKPGAFYYKAVLWAVENGITNGTGANTFSPGDHCTRGQAATFLWRSIGGPAPITIGHSFTDVNPQGYYYNAMLWAVGNGITNGTTPTTFAPGDPCTRGQIVTFLYRTFHG